MNEVLSKGDRVRVVTGCHKSNDGDISGRQAL